MGAGKTILIGAIIATEFAMAQEYPDADFVQNALVFAPGKTIIEALRELAEVPYDLIRRPACTAASPPRSRSRSREMARRTFRSSRGRSSTLSSRTRRRSGSRRRRCGRATWARCSRRGRRTRLAAKWPTSDCGGSRACRTWPCSRTKRTTPTGRACSASGPATPRPARASSGKRASRRSAAPWTILRRTPTSCASSTPRARRTSSGSRSRTW